MAKMTKEAARELLSNRKVYVNGKSAEIQKKLFEAGFKWVDGDTSVAIREAPFLYTYDDIFARGKDMEYFSCHENLEISAEEILAIEIDPECPFKPFDRVLVRDDDRDYWSAGLFSHYKGDEYPYVAAGGEWAQCIPFEGNEDLVGTKNEPKNERD